MAAEGVTAAPGTFDVAGVGVAALPSVALFPAHPVSRPPATAPAVTRVRRRDSLARRYSYCSAMLIRTARCSGMPTSGTGGSGGVPPKSTVMSMKLPQESNGLPA